MKSNTHVTFRYAFRASLPVFAGYLALGMGFGILLQSKGFAWWWATLMSLTMFTGSMQYLAVDLLAGGASLLTAALMTFMVNLRYLFYSIIMLEEYKGIGKAKPYLIFALTDETFSLVYQPKLPDFIDRRKYVLFVSLLDHAYWLFGSTLGAILGSILPFDTTGVDFAMTALFIVIFVEQWEKQKNHLPACIGIFVTVICRLIFGTSNFLIPAMIAMTLILFGLHPFLKGDDAHA